MRRRGEGCVLPRPRQPFPRDGYVRWRVFTPCSVVSPNFEGGRRFTIEDLVLDPHRQECRLASWSVLLSRCSSRLHDTHIRNGVVLTPLPAEDDLRDLHVSAFDRDLRLLDVLLPKLPLFGLDLRAWIHGLDRLLAEHEPLVSAGGAKGDQQDA